ncbi:hypothetical protein K438DRAFT_2075125 [Mycena galopus ATCC 62051]|nr:hypothetical protein K438DRAFT_2075125 [Mycena galopus ATCC 62051]
MAPTVFKVFNSFSTTTRQLNKVTQKFLAKKELHVSGGDKCAAAAFPDLGGLWILDWVYKCHFKFQCHLNNNDEAILDSPTAKSKKTDKRKRVQGPSLLSSLRDSCIGTVHALAQSHLGFLTYDNINLMNRITEQILGRKSAQENGTCATFIPLHNAKLEHLQTADLDASILKAPPLTMGDILLNEVNWKFFTENMIHTILGTGFKKWRDDLEKSQPVSADVIDIHKTPLHPLPAMEIDKTSITGNVEVIEEITHILGFKPDDPEYGKYVQIIAGDQLTITRQCSM